MATPQGADIFTPQIPAANQFSNVDFNSFGSQYASLYSHQMSALIQRQVYYEIYDAAPKGYYDDLKIMKMNGTETWKSDEVFYHEKVFGRNSVIATGNVAANVTQTIPVTPSSAQSISSDAIIVYPNNAKGTVVNVDTSLNQLTVKAMSLQTLPAVATNDVFGFQSTVEGDGQNYMASALRITTIERYNYIQMFGRFTRFGKMELYKYKNSGTTDYLAQNKQEVLNQYRIDLSNSYWNGERGEVTLANGAKAKTMGGIYPTMLASGSPTISTTAAAIKTAFEAAVFATQFNSIQANGGATKFFYATPSNINLLQQAYKTNLTRYFPPMEKANLTLNMITLAGNDIVLVPVQRFQEPSCFPASWANRCFLLDQTSIKACETWGDIMGETADRFDGMYNLNTFKDYWVSGTMSIKFQNPLASAVIDIS